MADRGKNAREAAQSEQLSAKEEWRELRRQERVAVRDVRPPARQIEAARRFLAPSERGR